MSAGHGVVPGWHDVPMTDPTMTLLGKHQHLTQS
jgi:hypothetical protein